MTFVLILTYAALVLAGLLALSVAFIGLARWVTQTTYDPDAEAH
ncbi:hypothetical protein BH23DEI1_BH23DEI1_05920 [soil metagenome]